MKDTKSHLLSSVKAAVSRYGLIRLTTRNLAEVAGVTDGLIYHYFKEKDTLICRAYEQENTALFDRMLEYLRDVQDIPFSERDKMRLFFHRTWREFLSDPPRLIFLTDFYHSVYFRSVQPYHNSQVELLQERVGSVFADEDTCRQTMFSLMSILYDAARRVVDGTDRDTPELEERIFSMFYALLRSQLSPSGGGRKLSTGLGGI